MTTAIRFNSTHIVSLFRLLVRSPDRHKRTLLVVDRLGGCGHRRNSAVVPARVGCSSVHVVDGPRWRRLGVRPPVINLVAERGVARVAVESFGGIQLARTGCGGRVVALIGGATVNVLERTLLLLLGPQPLLLFLQPRGTREGNR